MGRSGRGGLRALRPDAKLNERELLAWLEDKVSRYKLPKRVFFWDELPKSGYGKITKKIVREELEARGAATLDKLNEASA